MIELAGIEVTFGRGTALETRALRGIDLALAEGEFVTLIGSNGAGKSTLLAVLTGDVRPEQGTVRIDGRDVTAWPAPQRAPLMGRVFQDPRGGTCEALSIAENLAIARRRGARRGWRPALDRAGRAFFRERLASLGLGLEQRLDEPVRALSGGQRQALSLLMATLAPARLLLLDEHTAALDPRTAAFVLELTDRLVTTHRLTTLMVTHAMRQALDHGGRTVMLHEGRVVLDLGGAERARLDVSDLVALFRFSRGQELSDDALLTG